MRKVGGSLTVEAAIMIPLLLFVFAIAIESGMKMYMECQDTVLELESEEKIDVVQMFYIWNGIGELIGDGDTIY